MKTKKKKIERLGSIGLVRLIKGNWFGEKEILTCVSDDGGKQLGDKINEIIERLNAK